MRKNHEIKLVCLLIFLCMGSAFCQNNKLKQAEELVKQGKYYPALTILNSTKTSTLSAAEKALFNKLKAETYDAENMGDSAFYYYLAAKKHYLEIDSVAAAMKINLELAYLSEAQKKNKEINGKKYVQEYLDYANNLKDPLTLAYAYAELASIKINPEEYKEALAYFKKAIAYNKIAADRKLESDINNNLAAIYNDILSKPDSALYYFEKDEPYYVSVNDKDGLVTNFINQAVSHYYLRNFKRSVAILEKANKIALSKNRKMIKSYIYKYLSLNYEALQRYKEAYDNYITHQTYLDSINADEQAIAITNIETKFKTEEKELANKILKSNLKTNRILLYTFLGLTLATIIIGYLLIKNARRREKIAEQDILIGQQKLDKALKEYELQSIDLMLEGQEKERERIANDLHDNLGSMLATLKLNFENLRLRKNELAGEENKLYERTDELIEEAYQKVRRLAHAKNAGVLANEGLLPAVYKLAEKLTLPGKLKIHVVDFGFNSRLENTLEIAIFRMVQELATNIIKHSRATEATIHLTHHEDNINLIIEDNGIGFNPDAVNVDDGMGLQSIRKKVKQLNGAFTIDSTPGKGTTIIIDIPV